MTMFRRLFLPLLVVLGLALPVGAGWDPSKPPTSGALVSADMRANWSAIEQSLSGVNLVADPTPLIWAAGDTAAPSHWSVGGPATPTIARTGTGLGDTNRKVGPYAVKLVGGANSGYLQQQLLPPTMDTGYQGASVSCGAWTKTSSASGARVTVFDGVSTQNSSYNTGAGAWEWVTFTDTLNAAATQITLRLEVATGATVYFSGATCVLGQIPPKTFIPAPVVDLVDHCTVAGVQTVGNSKVGCVHIFSRPAIIRAVWINMHTTAPTVTGLIVRPTHWDGAAFQPIYTTQPQVAAGGFFGTKTAPDGTYRYRCFSGHPATGVPTDTYMNVDVTQIGSGVAGTDLNVHIQYMEFARPLEAFLAHADVN